jgi:protein-disulfide isomerase
MALSHVEELRQHAEEEHRQQQTAHDLRNQRIIGIIVVLVLLIALGLIGFFVWKSNQPKPTLTAPQAKAAVEKVEPKPTLATSNGGFVISKNGVGKPIAGVPTVQTYMDFMCPACGMFERQMGPTWQKLVDAGQINLEMHPNAFLDASSSDQYSTRATSAIVYVAQHAPSHLLTSFMAMYEQNYQPQEGPNYQSISNKKIAQQLEKAGVPHDVAQSAIKSTYTKWVTAMAAYTARRPELQHQSGEFKGEMTTPTILINGHYWDMSALPQNVSQQQAVIQALGLTENQVGNPHAHASIGAHGAPVFPQK